MARSRKPRKPFLGKSQKIEDTHICPNCGYFGDGSSGINNNARPTPGDIAVCIGCASVLKYTPEKTLRNITEEETNSLTVEQQLQIWIAIRAVQAMLKTQPRSTRSIH